MFYIGSRETVMQFVIVTGMSGAGKSTVMKMFEDMGYFCVDNIPIPLIGRFADMSFGYKEDDRKVALGVDIRSGNNISKELRTVFEYLKQKGYKYDILFLDANDMTLLKRYKETRRTHPLAKTGKIKEGIALERQILDSLRAEADHVIDTSYLLTRELKVTLEKMYGNLGESGTLNVMLISFGYKHGIPQECDLVFDVRFLPNPFYVEELKAHTGNEIPVQEYVMNCQAYWEFMKKLTDLLEFLIPNYVAEGKTSLVIGIGCTGGHHRSVTVANKLYEALNKSGICKLELEHRDIRSGVK